MERRRWLCLLKATSRQGFRPKISGGPDAKEANERSDGGAPPHRPHVVSPQSCGLFESTPGRQGYGIHQTGSNERRRPSIEIHALPRLDCNPTTPEAAWSLNNLAEVLLDQGDLQGARTLHQRALAIREIRLGPEHPETAWSLNLAEVLLDQGDLQSWALVRSRSPQRASCSSTTASADLRAPAGR